MPEKPNLMESAKRFWRETTGELVFIYDPTFIETMVTNGEQTTKTPWKRNPDGSITIGQQQILAAIESANAFKESLGREGAENTATVIGLSVAYIKKHFPQALKDAGYDE